MTITRTTRYYKVPQSVAATALGLTSIDTWSWDGDNIVVKHPDTETPNNPLANITKVTENYSIVPWNQIYTQFFSSIPADKFKRMSVTFDTVDIIVNLNLEE